MSNAQNGLDVEQAFRDHAATVPSRVARKVAAPRATIEDACSFAWMQAWRYRDRLNADPAPVLQAWLVRVAEREAWRLLRAPQPGAAEDYGTTVAATAADPADHEDALADRLRALDVLDTVSPQPARVLTLYSAGYSYDEISEQLGISYTAVNKALVKASTRMRRLRD